MDDRICRLSVRSIASHYRDGSLSPVEVVDAFLERIERLNPSLNAFVLVTSETARRNARLAEDRLRTSDNESLPPLFGIPFSVKDTLPTAGTALHSARRYFPISCRTKMLPWLPH